VRQRPGCAKVPREKSPHACSRTSPRLWALKDYGFKTVLSSRVADIFRRNSRKQSLLAAELAQDDIELIRKELANAPGTEVTVDLVSKTVICGNIVAPFEIDDYTR
jgi:3-isopropylmalate/(R)-2-methylmalate dehydratase small subunit